MGLELLNDTDVDVLVAYVPLFMRATVQNKANTK
jgi:hypothetical protein